MNNTLKLTLIIGSLLMFLYVLRTVYQRKLNIKYSILWIIWSLVVLIIALFPKFVVNVTKLVGIEIPSNAVFLIMIFILYCMMFFMFLITTKHTNEITILNYQVSKLNKKISDLEGKINEK